MMSRITVKHEIQLGFVESSPPLVTLSELIGKLQHLMGENPELANERVRLELKESNSWANSSTDEQAGLILAFTREETELENFERLAVEFNDRAGAIATTTAWVEDTEKSLEKLRQELKDLEDKQFETLSDMNLKNPKLTKKSKR